jgi:hypothetical protein
MKRVEIRDHDFMFMVVVARRRTLCPTKVHARVGAFRFGDGRAASLGTVDKPFTEIQVM